MKENKSVSLHPAIVDSESLKGEPRLVWSGKGKDRILTVVGRSYPKPENALVVSQSEAIKLYLNAIRRSSGSVKKAEWNEFVKPAYAVSTEWKDFVKEDENR